MLRAQLDAVCTDVRPDAVKIGMVPDSESAEIIAGAIEKYNMPNIVIDPVMVSTSGHNLSDGSAMSVMAKRVFRHASVLTPNLPEAETLIGNESKKLPKCDWAERIAEKYAVHAVLLKGGHSEGDTLVDVLWNQGKEQKFAHRRFDTLNTHGTGCSLSSAIACNLALGKSVTDSVADAIYWLNRAIEAGAEYTFGHGHGPVKHISVRELQMPRFEGAI